MDENPDVPDTGPATDPVSSILAALGGRPVLLPIDTRTKGPFFEDWQKLTWAQTQDPAHVLEFRHDVKAPDGKKTRPVYRTATYAELLAACVRPPHGKIGVVLGEPSRLVDADGEFELCSIDVDDDAGVEPFLADNAWLEGTLRTRGSRGCNFWLWVRRGTFPYCVKKLFYADPEEKALKPQSWGEWRAGGDKGAQTIIWGHHPKGMMYSQIGGWRAPLKTEFAAITWPADVEVPWRQTPWQKLEEKYGPPWFEGDKGSITLNHVFFVGKYATEHLTLFEPDEQEFYQYLPARGLWQIKSSDLIQTEIEDDFKAVADQARKPSLIFKRTNSFISGLVRQLRGRTEKRGAFEREAGIIHLKNCMLDLRCDPPQVKDFHESFFSRNQVPVDLVEGALCPLFLDFLASALSDDDIDLLQRWCGSLLLFPNKAQRFIVLCGAAGSGKGTLIGLMQRIVGEVNCAELRTEHLTERFEMAAYVGRTFLTGADVPGEFMQQEGAYQIKKLVGHDLINAEPKGGKPVQIRGYFNIGINCNSRLRVKLDGDTDAWRRRLLIVTYTKPKFKRRDTDLLNRLFSSEASGILNWMIAGAQKLMHECKPENGGDYRLSQMQRDRIDSLLAESDSVRHFVSNAVAPAEGDTVTLQELADAYTQYCEAKGWLAESFKRVQHSMVDAVQQIHRITPRNDIKRPSGEAGAMKSQRGYKGLRLLPAERKGGDDDGGY